MASGLGSPPIQQLIDRDIRPGLGIDDERLTPGDMFAQMRATISLQHATVFDLKLAGKAGVPKLMGTRDVIRYATVDGARVAGLGRRDRIARAGQAGRHRRAPDRPAQHLPDQRPDRRRGVGHGHLERRLACSSVDGVVMRNGVLEADVQRARSLATAARQRVADRGRSRRRRGPGGERMSAPRSPSSAVTSFVVASRYLPVYVAIALLVVVASIWAPATLSGPALSAIAPFGTFLAITALGQMLVIMTGGIDLSVPGHVHASAAVMTVGVGTGVGRAHLDRRSAIALARWPRSSGWSTGSSSAGSG